MKALTVKQPWAWAIGAGYKTVENRSRDTSYRGLLAIHAGKAWSKRGAADKRVFDAAMTAAGGVPFLADLALAGAPASTPQGAVIAVAELVGTHLGGRGCGCVWGDADYDGKPIWHWELRGAQLLSERVPCRGALGLWTVPDDVEAAIRAQLTDDALAMLDGTATR